ncbi:cupin domain-containing protein [Herbidospora sp. RD11066]
MTDEAAGRPSLGGLSASVGQNVRAERQRQGISIRALAKRLGVSPSFLSQFELGQCKAAVSTLFAITSELNMSLDELLEKSAPGEGPRPGHSGTTNQGADNPADYLTLQSGVRWKRLADTGPGHHVQFLLTEYDPGSDSAPRGAPQVHKGDDYGYVLKGTLTIELDGETKTLHAGDSIQIRGDIPHRLRNLGDEVVQAIWCTVD